MTPTLHPVPEDRPAPRPAVQVAGEAFALELANLPDDKRAGWVIYALETLDPGMVDSAFDDLLADLRAAIDGRLASGTW